MLKACKGHRFHGFSFSRKNQKIDAKMAPKINEKWYHFGPGGGKGRIQERSEKTAVAGMPGYQILVRAGGQEGGRGEVNLPPGQGRSGKTRIEGREEGRKGGKEEGRNDLEGKKGRTEEGSIR